MARRQQADDEPVRLGAVLEFMRTLWAINHQLESMSKRMDRNFGVTGPQRLALRIVGQLPGIGATRLATIMHLDPSTLTGVLRRLTDRGLVTRGRDARDGRRAVLT